MKATPWRKRLLKSTRGRILAALRTGDRTVNELAAELKLTDNAIRAHLQSLTRDRLVQQSGTQPGVRKPHVTYSLTPGAEQIFPKAYGPLLDVLLGVFSRKLSHRELEAAMREAGETIGDGYLSKAEGKTRDERIKLALKILKELGGAATFQESEGKHLIRGNGCSLAAATSHHPAACLIAESLLARVIGTPVRERCLHGPEPACCFEVS